MGAVLTSDKVAERAGVSVATIHSYVHSRLIPEPQRIGRTLFWDSDVIDAWLAARPGRGFRSDLQTTTQAQPEQETES